MGVLPECRESDKLKIIYQPWRAGEFKITFPNDGLGEARLSSERGTEKTSKTAIDYRVEHHVNEDRYAHFGTATSAIRLQTREGEIIIDCGDTIYWTAEATKDEDFSEVIGDNNGYVQHADGNWYQIVNLTAGLITQERFNKRHVPISTPAEIGEGAIIVAKFKTVADKNYETYEGSECEIRNHSRITDFLIKPGTLQYVSTELVQSQYSTYFVEPDGEERFVTKRMTQPIEGELFDPYLADPIEVEYSKPSNDYDFYAVARSHYQLVYIYSEKEGDYKILGYLRSDSRQPPPEYTYSCDVEQCEDDEYQLDCRTHWCCYRSDGVATKRIEK